jgi:hypothetical protein
VTHAAIDGWLASFDGTDPVSSVEVASWSFSTPTWVVTHRSGRRHVAQVLADRSIAERVRLGTSVIGDLGIPVPNIVEERTLDGGVLVATAAIDGSSGASLIGTAGAGAMARAMGTVAARLRNAADPRLDAGSWFSSRTLRTVAAGWNLNLTSEVDHALDIVGDDWLPVVSHGDFVPVNFILGHAYEVAALLDLADVALRHPLLDVAWWCLVVRHHHPVAYPNLRPEFLQAGGLQQTRALMTTLGSLALLRLCELLAERGSSDGGPGHLIETVRIWAAESHET